MQNYKEFIEQEDNKETLKLLESRIWPSMLGSKSFVDKIKERFFGEKTEDYVPQSKELAPEVEKIKKIVCAFYGVDETVLYSSLRGVMNEPRNMTIYLTRRLRTDSLTVIGSHFNFLKYSSVSSTVDRMTRLIKKDSSLSKRMKKLVTSITKSQE